MYLARRRMNMCMLGSVLASCIRSECKSHSRDHRVCEELLCETPSDRAGQRCRDIGPSTVGPIVR